MVSPERTTAARHLTVMTSLLLLDPPVEITATGPERSDTLAAPLLFTGETVRVSPAASLERRGLNEREAAVSLSGKHSPAVLL